MQTKDSVWQGHFGYWQHLFIEQNILVVGYTAWNGYLNAGRGIVVCDVTDAFSCSIDWSVDPVPFRQEFIPQTQAERYLETFDLEENTVTTLLKAISTYDPNQSIVVLVMGGGEVALNLLQRLAIAPADCYRQVQHRWAEFQSDLTSSREPHL